MTIIFEYTIDQAIGDGILMDLPEIAKPVQPIFPLGRLVISTNAQERLNPEDYVSALTRHVRGDWGNLCDHDREQNEWALRHGGRLLSVYDDRDNQTFWIITEADRSATTILLPEDY